MEEQKHPYLKSHYQIGSCKGPMQFPVDESVFPKPSNQLLARKKEIINYKRENTLIQPHPSWNQATNPNNPPCVRNFALNHYFDQGLTRSFDFRSAKVPTRIMPTLRRRKFDVIPHDVTQDQLLSETYSKGPFKPYSIRGEERRNRMSGGGQKMSWNSCTISSNKEREEAHKKRCQTAKINSSRWTQTLSAPGSTYKSALEKSDDLRAEHKERRINPPPSPPLPPTHNRYAIEPNVKSRRYQHSGVWEFDEREGCHRWSDTGSCVREDGRGDISLTINPNRPNFSSIN